VRIERPILFSSLMVCAIRMGLKHQTRRIIKKPPEPFGTSYYPAESWFIGRHPGGGWRAVDLCQYINPDGFEDIPEAAATGFGCPHGWVGDRLWVREAWATHRMYDLYKPSGLDPEVAPIVYLAGRQDYKTKPAIIGKTRPSIFMPRWAARTVLQIRDVRVERLQDISEEDAVDEGIAYGFRCNAGWPDYEHIRNGVCEVTQDSAGMSFASLWDSLNAKRGISWEANPWVWVINFRMI